MIVVLAHSWRWVESNGKYYPVFMAQLTVPDYLLQYKCKANKCKANKCDKKACYCKKYDKIKHFINF